jgi:hypothetical protein
MPKFDFVAFFNSFIAQVEQFPWLAQKLIGGLMIIVGLLGLILPIIPGWVFILPGLGIIHPPFRTKLVSFEKEKKLCKRVKVGFTAIKTMKFNRLRVVVAF